MKSIVQRFIFGLVAVLQIVGCSNDPNAPFSIFPSQQTTTSPAKEIYVSEDDISNPYVVLGSVKYTLRSDFPIFSNQADLRNRAIENLKQEAVTRYGNDVDAIINLVFQESPEQDSYFSPNIIYIRGTAIAYKPGTKTYSKPKRKHKVKVSKNTSSKAKSSPKTLRKPVPERQDEPEITPSEMLK
jgi:hypothetical protein